MPRKLLVLGWCRRWSSAEGLSLAIAIEVPIFLSFFDKIKRKEIEVPINPCGWCPLFFFRNGEMLLCLRSDPISLISMAYVEQNNGFVVSSSVITKKPVINSVSNPF